MMIGLISRIWSACDLILKIIQIYSLISSLLQEIGKLDFERHCNLKKIVLQELSVRKRMRYNVGLQFRETPWGKFLRMPELLIPESYFARPFQRRLRLPYPLFLQLVEDAKDFNIFDLNMQEDMNYKANC